MGRGLVPKRHVNTLCIHHAVHDPIYSCRMVVLSASCAATREAFAAASVASGSLRERVQQLIG